MSEEALPIEECLRLGRRPQGSELTDSDVGRLLSVDGFGRVLDIDIGKRVWLRPYGLVMENNAQRDARLKGSGR